MEHKFLVYQSLELGPNAAQLYMCRDTPYTSGYINAFHKWLDGLDEDEMADPEADRVVVDDIFLYMTGHWTAKRPPAALPPCLWDVDPVNMEWSSELIQCRFLRLGGSDIETITVIQGVEASEKADADDEDRQMGKEDWKAFKAARAAKRPAVAAPEDEPEAKRRRVE